MSEKKLASLRVIDFTVPRIAKEEGKLKAAILAEAKAVEEDGAEVIVLSCTGGSGFMKENDKQTWSSRFGPSRDLVEVR
jgi:Asp/Glu/hydantoin racemase